MCMYFIQSYLKKPIKYEVLKPIFTRLVTCKYRQLHVEMFENMELWI